MIPNILWICTDQQRFDTLGCYGNPWVTTPNIDRLAASGVLFEHAYCQNPLCTPSRASFLTGRYPRTTRTRQNGQSIPEDEVLVTRMLAESGYYCGLAGKLHLSAAHPSVAAVRERRIEDGYTEFYWSHHPDREWPTADYNIWLAERGYKFGREWFEDSRYVQTSMPEELHQTTWCADRAIEFIERHARPASDGGAAADESGQSEPWLFSANIYDPHHPFDPPEEYLRPYLDRLDEIPLPNYVEGELANKPLFQQIDHTGAYGGLPGFYSYDRMDERDHRQVTAAYWAMVDLIDVQVGRILDSLERTGQRENTLVIFMSDHGELLGDHGIYLKGPFFYEPSIRVPLIFSWPGVIEQNVRSKALVELVEIAPTLLDLAGLPRYSGMQGISLEKLLTGEEPASRLRDNIYCEHYGTTYPEPGRNSVYATMLRTERYKLVVMHGMVTGELYDLREDPNETVNHYADPAYFDVRAELLLKMTDRMAYTADPLPNRDAKW